ncbi:VanZ family protein [Thalassotalea agarivorans]|uniref:VanZ like family protein n=1 Tax=Thalassotalea agarivorans TaxID=349064 RepID=A0A1I0APS2_THASX|nr:VanZ family protein [Thalassotalea agarivorans]SES95435.1 VanZ like family protein [Thalassotalea agarivorans]
MFAAKKQNQSLLLKGNILLVIALIVFAWALDVPAETFKALDTVGHFVGFLVLTAVCHYFTRIPLTTLVICLICYAALTELSQYYLGFRNGEVRDVIANIFGICSYIFLFALLSPKRRKL